MMKWVYQLSKDCVVLHNCLTVTCFFCHQLGLWFLYFGVNIPTATPKLNMDHNILFEVFCSPAEIIAGVKELTTLQCCYYTDEPGNQEDPKQDSIDYQDLNKTSTIWKSLL